uniref:Interleukin-4 n=1 Tax=Sus scrofa TaxID=9823 RepID=A0A8D0NNR6_PIG
MGLTSQLIPTLVCLLACTSNFIHGHKCDITLQEIIKTLNILTARKNSCMELPVTDVFAAPENTTEKEIFCRASTVLRHIYRHHTCMKSLLSGLDRNLSSMANMVSCPVPTAWLLTDSGLTSKYSSLGIEVPWVNQAIHSFDEYLLRLCVIRRYCSRRWDTFLAPTECSNGGVRKANEHIISCLVALSATRKNTRMKTWAS